MSILMDKSLLIPKEKYYFKIFVNTLNLKQ